MGAALGMQHQDRQRMGEIAIAVLKYQLGQDGIKLNSSFRRKLGHMAKEIGIPLAELTDFSEQLIQELIEENVRSKSKKDE